MRHNITANPDHPSRPAIAEPATSLTDLLLAGQTLFYANRLWKGPVRTERSSMLWSLALAAAGVAALAGAVTHAIYEDTTASWLRTVRRAAWKLVGLSIAAASALLLAGSIVSSISPRRRRLFLVAVAVKTFAFAVAGWRSGDFLFTILDYGASMLVVLYLQLRNWRTSHAAPWLSAGVLVSFAGVAVQRSGIALHARFNHNDLYHVVQMVAFHLLYEGARREVDCSPKPDSSCR